MHVEYTKVIISSTMLDQVEGHVRREKYIYIYIVQELPAVDTSAYLGVGIP